MISPGLRAFAAVALTAGAVGLVLQRFTDGRTARMTGVVLSAWCLVMGVLLLIVKASRPLVWVPQLVIGTLGVLPLSSGRGGGARAGE